MKIIDLLTNILRQHYLSLLFIAGSIFGHWIVYSAIT